MKKSTATSRILGALVAVGMSATAFDAAAAVQMEVWGSAAPQATLGGFSVIPFELDLRPLGTEVTTFTPPGGSPVSGDVVSDTPLSHAQVGSGWATWSHGYTGDVYWMDEDAYGTYDPQTDTYGSVLHLALPTGTKAFYFYLEPNFMDVFDFTVTSGSVSETLAIHGNGGAQGVGIFTDDPSLDLLSIQIGREGTFSDGYGIGEFGINGEGQPPVVPEVPAPTAFLTLLCAGIAALRARRQTQAR